MKKEEIEKIFEEWSLSPRKSLGQNFLVNESVLEKVVKAGDVGKGDVVIEVGAGIGVLTKALAGKAKKVIALEKDKNLIPLLEMQLGNFSNVEIINEDVLSYKVKEKDYKIIANIPYYITSPIIRKFLEAEHPPSLLVLTIQKEVAERIKAKPPKMNLLAVSVQLYSDVEIISNISPAAFYPSPGVTSSIIKIKPFLGGEAKDKKFRKAFFRIARAGFSSPRKQLKNNLGLLDKGDRKEIESNKENVVKAMKDTGITPQRRAETLNIEEWKILAKKIKE